MTGADLDNELSRLRPLVERCASEAEARELLRSMIRDDVPMLRGTVIPASLWAQARPAFGALRDQLHSIVARGERSRQTDLRARHIITLRLCYPAHIDDYNTHDVVTDAAIIAGCAGGREYTHLERYDLPAPVLRLEIHATVENGAHGLEVVIAVPLEREATDSEVTAIVDRVDGLLYTGWGNNYDFPIPNGLRSRYVVRFSTEPVRAEHVPASTTSRTPV